MPRRFSANIQIWIYRYLVVRDGEQCARCFEKPGVQNSGVQNERSFGQGYKINDSLPLKLEIDHIDGEPWNNDPDNLRLLCKRCNILLRNKPRPAYSPKIGRERKEGCASTRIVREVVDYSNPDAPVTMQANFLFEVDARKWCLSKVAEKGFYPKKDTWKGMAELVGCATQTARNYLDKLTGPLGPLREVKDMLGGIMLTWKEGYEPEPSIKIDPDNNSTKERESGTKEPRLFP